MLGEPIEGEIIDPKPKKQRKQPKRDNLSVKRRRGLVVKGVIEGKSPLEICRESGMSELNPTSAVNQVLRHPETQILFAKVMEKEGITDERLAQKIDVLLDAKKTIFAQKDGIFTDERTLDDLDQQRKTLELATRLKGHLKNDDGAKTDISVGLMSVVINAISMKKEGK